MYKSLLPLATLGVFSLVRAQSSVPSDLSSAFDENQIALQVSFDDQSDNGFQDGTKFTSQQTSQTPTFALGDSSGVNTALNLMVMMIDTTDDNQRVLHFLQPGFKATEDKTAIASNSQPVQAYKAPGSLGDAGLRKYSFLLYSQPSKGFQPSGMPSPGSAFNVEDFMKQNNLQPALAGIGMQVQISGGSSASQPPAQASSSAPPPPPSPPAPATSAALPSVPPVASVSASAIIPIISSAIPPALSTLVSQASQGIESASVAASSAIESASAEVSSAIASGSAVVGSLTSSAEVAVSTAAANGTVASATSAIVSSTPTSSNAPTQTSSNAIAHRGNAFAAIPWFIIAGIVLG